MGSAGSSPAVRTRLRSLLALVLGISLGSCGSPGEEGAADVSVIGASPRLLDPNRAAPDAPSAVLLGSVAQGLVAFDADGQIEPALAERWVITDDGRSYIFRIGRARWADDREITAEQVAASLRATFATASRNRLKPILSAIEAVVPMTGKVVEIRLRTPRPALLQLLAQPEMGIRRGMIGTGPYRIHMRREGATVLRPILSEEEQERADEMSEEDRAAGDMRLRGERAALAIARYRMGESRLVLGGGFDDLVLARAARVPNEQIVFDPVVGLFGLAITGKDLFFKTSEIREALAMAIDREAFLQSIGVPSWEPAVSLLPLQLDSADVPATPGWATVPLPARRLAARSRVSDYRTVHGALPVVRVALPASPGARMLLARLTIDWGRAGLEVRRVGMNAEADLRLIDEVAPNASANWYLSRVSCARGLVCDEDANQALLASRAAPDLATRAAEIAKADQAYAIAQTFIPIAVPLRWSLVSSALPGYRPNAFAIHRLERLRTARR